MRQKLLLSLVSQDKTVHCWQNFYLKKLHSSWLKRRASSFNTKRIDSIYEDHQVKSRKLILHYGDLIDSLSLLSLLNKIRPDEIYNLGAQSHVAISFLNPEYTTNVDGIGNLRILEAINSLNFKKKIKFFQASTSEMYGKQYKTLNENQNVAARLPKDVGVKQNNNKH